MSDSIEELARRYREDVLARQPRRFGLFPIPEYPELASERGMWAEAVQAILTTLRYLAPATLLTLFWGQQSFFFTLIKHIDNAFRAIVFSSEEQKQEVLQWLAEAGPMTVEHLDTVWTHGWVLCSVLDEALPGACSGHPPTRQSLQHAQTIADHYLGVEPVFSRQELEANDSLSRRQEWKLATYLDRIRQALSKITPPVSKPTSLRTSPETNQFTFDYVAKGSGLTAAQINDKMSFKIYPTSQQALDPGEVTILIKGPKDTYGMTVLPPILGKAQKIRQKLLGLQSKQTFTENALPITQGATYLRAYGKNDMNKTYFIPKPSYDVEIEVEKRLDHTKVWYTVNREGKYEISITSRGLSIVGSPFMVKATPNIIGILEKENFCLENGEEIDIVDVKTDRKVVLRIVDFVTEKMLLRENGTLEKISEAEAKILMTTDVENERSISVTEIHDHNYKSNKFNEVAKRILKMNRVCKAFNDLMEEKCKHSKKNKTNMEEEKQFAFKRSQNDIPDIVNSTLCDTSINPFILLEDRYIVPENISVSITTEKSQPFYKEEILRQARAKTPRGQVLVSRTTSPDSLEDKVSEDDDNMSIDRLTPLSSSNNPFLSEAGEDFAVDKKLGTFVKSEYETNNSQNEETRDNTIKILIDNNTPSPVPTSIETNPFVVPDARLLERPKTPVYKIITGELSNRVDSPYLDPKNALLSEAMMSNEFVNPFFVHQLQSSSHYDQPMTDFIIGAPVSLPPTIRASTPEPNKMLCREETGHLKQGAKYDDQNNDDISPSVFSTPTHTKIEEPKDQAAFLSSTFHSLDSDLTDTIDISNASTSSDGQFEPYRIETSRSNRHFSPKKDLWDSAYVSIDENNASPDNNNNENNTSAEMFSKQKYSSSEESYDLREEELANMGPAEIELWKTCGALNETNQVQEEVKPYRWELKRPMCTPIIEENEKSLSSMIKDVSLKLNEADSVTVAFAEINDIYQEYFPKSEKSSSVTSENEIIHRNKNEQMETDDTGVESASETLSDVMRHEIGQEGKISEVQANVTESVSASQTLHDKTNKPTNVRSRVDEIQFGDNNYSNIVLEKKKYWDDKIRQIEAKTEESSKQLKKRRIPAKQLKHDSLSKRKGKQMIKNILNGSEQGKVSRQNSSNKSETPSVHSTDKIELRAEEKLVDKWRKFWDEKLESEHEYDSQAQTFQNSPTEMIKTSEISNSVRQESLRLNLNMPVQLPEEEVFKAFETSPKRFFGTSRKRILNKIDTFLGKPVSVNDDPIIEPDVVSPDSGLVSSRISLFHSMSTTEPFSETRSKSMSSHNIHSRKGSSGSTISIETPDVEKTNIKLAQEKKSESNTKGVGAEKVLGTDSNYVPIKEKRARMIQKSFNQSFDEIDHKKLEEQTISDYRHVLLKPKKEYRTSHIEKYKKFPGALRKTSISKSEMDIFNKVPIDADDGLDKHKSYDELPKINVKSFISLYENVSKSSVEPRPVKRIYRPNSVDSQTFAQPISLTSDADENPSLPRPNKPKIRSIPTTTTESPTNIMQRIRTFTKSPSIESVDVKTDNESLNSEPCFNKHKETTYVSLSDIELEIVESSPEKSCESSPERETQPHIDYKNRFKQAKQYFQSLEELREIKKPKKLNECQLLLLNKSTESLETEPVRPKRLKKKVKSHSMPSSEIAKYWNEMQESKTETTKLVKISEKFHVDDLFSDVMEGKLSRQGSLRGIPHKKAVLEAFRSMENISVDKLSPYEMSTSEITDFTNESRVTSAQNYLSEYPYLPTTDPSKYHSRLDARASGLITLKELKKHRRNSVPDLRLNPKFSADL